MEVGSHQQLEKKATCGEKCVAVPDNNNDDDDKQKLGAVQRVRGDKEGRPCKGMIGLQQAGVDIHESDKKKANLPSCRSPSPHPKARARRIASHRTRLYLRYFEMLRKGKCHNNDLFETDSRRLEIANAVKKYWQADPFEPSRSPTPPPNHWALVCARGLSTFTPLPLNNACRSQKPHAAPP